MNKNILISGLLTLGSFGQLHAWGKKSPSVSNTEVTTVADTYKENSVEKRYQSSRPARKKNNYNTRSKMSLNLERKLKGKTKAEMRELVLSELKNANTSPLNLINTGETLFINIPISNPVLISFYKPIEDIIWPEFISGPTLKILNQSEIAQGGANLLKLRSLSPLLKNEEILVKLENGEWVRISFSTRLNEEKYNEINILEELEILEKEKIKELKNKYFNKKINVREISKKEVLKSIKMIVDRLETNTKAHIEQLAIEEKIDSLILNDKERKISIILRTVVSEPFQIVGAKGEDKIDSITETEIVMLNLTIENYGDKTFKLNPNFFKNAFNNYISFWYDINDVNVAPSSSKDIIVVIEDQRMD